MSNHDSAAAMLQLLLESNRPTLVGRLKIVTGSAEHHFHCQPFGNRVAIVFGLSVLRTADLMEIIEVAAASAEQLLHKVSVANAHRLTPIDWWIFRQRELPCSE